MSLVKFLTLVTGWLFIPQNLCFETLIPKVTELGVEIFGRKIGCGPHGGISVLIKRETRVISLSPPPSPHDPVRGHSKKTGRKGITTRNLSILLAPDFMFLLCSPMWSNRKLFKSKDDIAHHCAESSVMYISASHWLFDDWLRSSLLLGFPSWQHIGQELLVSPCQRGQHRGKESCGMEGDIFPMVHQSRIPWDVAHRSQ